jgi:hypothetical protein
VKDTEQVDLEHPLDRLGIDLQHRTVAGDAGIGHNDVDATEAFDGRGGGRDEDYFAVQRCHGRQSTLPVGLGVRLCVTRANAATRRLPPILSLPRRACRIPAHRWSNHQVRQSFWEGLGW